MGVSFLAIPRPIAAIPALGSKIVHCHVEDMPAGKHDHRLPGEGDMDLGVYIRALRAAGFGGGMALDLYAYDYEAVAAGAVRHLKNVMSMTDRAAL